MNDVHMTSYHLGALVQRIVAPLSLDPQQRVQFVTPGDIEWGTGRAPGPFNRVPPSTGALQFQQGDVLFSRVEVSRRRVWEATTSGGCSPDFFVLRPGPKVSPRYLAHLLRSVLLSEWLAAYQSGLKRPSIEYSALEGVLIPVPPLADQERISSILNEALASLRKIDWRERFLGSVATAAFRRLFGSSLDRYADTTPPLSHFADVRQGLSDSFRQALRPANLGHEFGRVSARNVYRHHIRLHESAAGIWVSTQEAPEQQLQEGDVLFHIPVGFSNGKSRRHKWAGTAAVWEDAGRPCVPDMSLIRIRQIYTGVLPEFLAGWLNSNWIHEQLPPVELKSLALALQQVRVPLPPIGTQRRFTEIVAEVRTARELSRQQRSSIAELYGTLADRALNGSLTGLPMEVRVDVSTTRTIVASTAPAFPTERERPVLGRMDRQQQRIWQAAWEFGQQPFTFRQFCSQLQVGKKGATLAEDEIRRTLDLLSNLGCLVEEPFGDFVRWRRPEAEDRLEV